MIKAVNTITYYNLANIFYSGFFLTGFQQNQRRFDFELVISNSAPVFLEEISRQIRWRGLLDSVCLFKAETQKGSFYFCIDTRDSCRPEVAGGYLLPLIDKVKYYFKVNYNAEVNKSDPVLKIITNIFPACPGFPLRPGQAFRFLLPPYSVSGINQGFHPALARIRQLYGLVDPAWMLALRNVKKDIDIFFVSRFYREHPEDMEFRLRVMQEIRKQGGVSAIMGFSADVPRPFSGFRTREFNLKDYLLNLARAKVAVYTRGIHSCISFKFGQYLALGKAIVGQAIQNNKEMLYINGDFSRQFVFESPREIAGEALRLAGSPCESGNLGKQNSGVFDTFFAPQPAIAQMLEMILGRK